MIFLLFSLRISQKNSIAMQQRIDCIYLLQKIEIEFVKIGYSISHAAKAKDFPYKLEMYKHLRIIDNYVGRLKSYEYLLKNNYPIIQQLRTELKTYYYDYFSNYSPEAGFYDYTPKAGEKLFAITGKTITIIDGLVASLTEYLDLAQLKYANFIKFNIILISLICFLGVIFLAIVHFFTNVRFNTIITNIRRSTNAISQGDFDTPVEVTKNDGVLSQLTFDVDIMRSNLKNLIEQKEMLMREIYHRVKNNLQVVISMLQLQSSKMVDESCAGILKDSENRLQIIAMIHEKLYQSADLYAINCYDYIMDFSRLLQDLFKVKNRIQMEYNIDRDMILSIDQLVPLGLIINELVTNAIKYAFPDEKTDAEIRIELVSLPDNLIKLVIADNGIGIPEKIDLEKTNTLGLRLFRTLSKQINGKYSYKNDHGAVFEIIFKKYIKRGLQNGK
jgi:two-component sensor histidine kinase